MSIITNRFSCKKAATLDNCRLLVRGWIRKYACQNFSDGRPPQDVENLLAKLFHKLYYQTLVSAIPGYLLYKRIGFNYHVRVKASDAADGALILYNILTSALMRQYFYLI